MPSPVDLTPRYRIRDDVGVWEASAHCGAAWLFPAALGPTVAAAFEEVRSGTILDVGASFGYFTVRWARQLGAAGQMIAVEPHPDRYAALCHNVAANRLANVIARRVAVGDRQGTVTLYEPPVGGARDISFLGSEGHPFTAPMQSLDAIVAEVGGPPVAAVKLDIEGAEPLALAGLTATLRRDRPLVVFEAQDGASQEASGAILRLARYAVTPLGPGDWLARPEGK